MTERSIDRRIVRTRKRLHDALLSLVLKRDYEAITVEEICEAADVSRSTFYDHYTGKDDLKRSGLNHLRGQLLERQGKSSSAERGDDPILRFSRSMFEHALEHKHHYKALVGSRGGAIALGTIRQIVGDAIRRGLESSKYDREIPAEIVIEYLVGAYMAMLTWWLDRGAKLSPEHMDSMYRHMAIEGVSSQPV